MSSRCRYIVNYVQSKSFPSLNPALHLLETSIMLLNTIKNPLKFVSRNYANEIVSAANKRTGRSQRLLPNSIPSSGFAADACCAPLVLAGKLWHQIVSFPIWTKYEVTHFIFHLIYVREKYDTIFQFQFPRGINSI